jgi:hypothetical protein
MDSKETVAVVVSQGKIIAEAQVASHTQVAIDLVLKEAHPH